MQRLWIAVQAIERGDILLTTDARCEPHHVYADRVHGTHTLPEDNYVYVVTDNDRFRFTYDQQVTVLRGI